MDCCGHCDRYLVRPFGENICTRTGKVVGYLWVKDCFSGHRSATIEKKEMEEEKKTKVCRTCGRELPLSMFGKQIHSSDGYRHDCRECCSKKMKERLDKVGTAPVAVPMEVVVDENPLKNFASKELVEELRARGYDVTCRKTIEL